MIYNDHSELEGKHAFLSPSNYHWLNYDEQRLAARFQTHTKAHLGSKLHNLAQQLIEMRIKLPKNSKTLNLYVNDCIGYRMSCEVPLYYSPNCFGHTDALKFSKNKLRVSDLKTGVTKASMMQLKVYAALFCLEYSVDPFDIEIELRIYQNDSVLLEIPNAEEIAEIMNKIIDHDEYLERLKGGAL